MNKKILILPGDGIGPEVTSSAMEVLKFITDLYSLELDIEIMMLVEQLMIRLVILFLRRLWR